MHARKDGREQPLTSLVFPTYNARPFIDRTWAAVRDFLTAATGRWEILFACDGPTDGTAERLMELAAHGPASIRVLCCKPNRGKGHAVRQGLRAARGAWRLFTDVDLAYGFDDVVRVAETLRNGAEVAIASRTHPESRIVVAPELQGYAYRRHLQSQIFSAVVRLLLPLAQADTQAGLKGMSAAAAERVLPHLRCDGFGFDCELLTACVRFGLNVREVPVSVQYVDAASTTSVASMGRMLREIWSIRRTWRKAPNAASVVAAPRRAA
jgi:dolichyl-phosphate beta-glucosyltransferase